MNELFQLKEKTEEKKRLESQLKKTLIDFYQTNEKLSQLSSLIKKQPDDTRLLNISEINSLFYSILGNKTDKTDKERQEYVFARLKHENCLNEVKTLKIEIERIKLKIAELCDSELNYSKLLDIKISRLKLNANQKWIEYEQQVELHFKSKNELNGAIEAGEMATKELRQVIQSLRTLKNHRIHEKQGEGLIAAAIKNSGLDEVKILVQDVQVWLKKFKRELSTVSFASGEELSVYLSSFDSFADNFFKNLISDWVLHDKINSSAEGCEITCKQVLELVTQLRISDVNNTQKFQITKNDFNLYIEKSIV